MVTHIRIRQAAAAIEANFTKADIERGILKFAKDFLRNNQALVKKEGVGDKEWKLLQVKYPNKDQLSTLAGLPFASEVLFKTFRDSLPQKVREVLRALVWRESLSSKIIKQDLGFEVYDTTTKVWSSSYSEKKFALKSEFEFFKNKGNENGYSSRHEPLFNLSLGIQLQRIIRQYYPRPRYADFIFVDEISETDYFFFSFK